MHLNIYFTLLFLSVVGYGQHTFTRADSLQGSLRTERTSFDVLRYDLNVDVFPETKEIYGSNTIQFKVVENQLSKIQLDLFENMLIDSIIYKTTHLSYIREYDAVFIDFKKPLLKNSIETIQFYYHGKPTIAIKPPWDGGFVWKKDTNQNDWIGVAVQGTGASLWYPVKDHQSDEPDFGASIKITTPSNLVGVSNGRLIDQKTLPDQKKQWHWEVKNPINNYNITLNVGDYVHFGENYKGLDLDYYVLRDNLDKAKIHFEEVKPMLDCFQEKFGKFPFWEDGYKMVETPYLGMEHQSAIAYGNQYKKGYLGHDLSGTGIGLHFDYITIHESGHEWFGNSITSSDIADMWIHEGFTTYAEGVFVECLYGYDKAVAYINGKKSSVSNKKAIIGAFGVNFKTGNSDMYSKGSLLLHTLRSVINDDEKWWAMLLEYSNTYKHKIIDTQTVIDFFNAKSGKNLTSIFNQYLRYPSIPVLELKLKKDTLYYRWKTDTTNFEMPVELKHKETIFRLNGDNHWQKSNLMLKSLSEISLVDQRFYVILDF